MKKYLDTDYVEKLIKLLKENKTKKPDDYQSNVKTIKSNQNWIFKNYKLFTEPQYNAILTNNIEIYLIIIFNHIVEYSTMWFIFYHTIYLAIFFCSVFNNVSILDLLYLHTFPV